MIKENSYCRIECGVERMIWKKNIPKFSVE
jgi:hypothetical protein